MLSKLIELKNKGLLKEGEGEHDYHIPKKGSSNRRYWGHKSGLKEIK